MAISTPEARICIAIEEIRSYFQQDGGDIEFVRFEDGVVYLRLQGRCVGCPQGMCMLYQTILEHVQQVVPEVLSVQRVTEENL